MMDRRLTLANERIADIALQGQIEAPAYGDVIAAEVALPVADLLAEPDGARARQLLLGEGFEVLELHEGYAFGRASKDGYCGYLTEASVSAPTGVSHWVAAPGTHLYSEPKVQAPKTRWLSFGSRVRVLGQTGAFAQTPHGYIPIGHLQMLGSWYDEPVEVMGLFLGVPYLWGGNSFVGIDCSGLVQAAMMACGKPCPGDSDLQQSLGTELAPEEALQRGDLVFWKRHVGMMIDANSMIHANGHFMATVIEPVAEAIARISEARGGDVLAKRRL
jgi:cell wall-associated NlpC family hydrolase